jgi:cell division protein FtsQ
VSRPPRVVSAGPRLAAKAQAARLERRHARLRRALVALACAAPLVLLGWVLTSSSLLAVRNVIVTGEARLTVAQIEAAAAVTPGTPLARIDTAAVARRIRALGPVGQVSVTRSWPHALRVKVVERVPVVGVQRSGGWLLLDGAGVELGASAGLPRGVLALAVPSPTPDDPATAAALTVLRGLPRGLRAQVGSLRASSPEQVTLLLRGGRQVVWGGTDDEAAKAAAVMALMKLPGTVFDVSAPGVVTRR